MSTLSIDTDAKASCTGKEGFTSAKLAHTVTKRQRQRNTHDHNHPPSPYRCQHCGLFHLGWAPKSAKITKQRRAW